MTSRASHGYYLGICGLIILSEYLVNQKIDNVEKKVTSLTKQVQNTSTPAIFSDNEGLTTRQLYAHQGANGIYFNFNRETSNTQAERNYEGGMR